MAKVSAEYLDSLAPIYRNIFQVYAKYNPALLAEQDLPWQTIYSSLRDQYSFAEVFAALDQLVKNHVLKKRNETFYAMTPLGDEILSAMGNKQPVEVPPFSPPPVH